MAPRKSKQKSSSPYARQETGTDDRKPGATKERPIQAKVSNIPEAEAVSIPRQQISTGAGTSVASASAEDVTIIL